MMDRQPIRAAEIAREQAFSWLPARAQVLLTPDLSGEYNALIADALLSFSGPKSLSKPIRSLIPSLSAKDAIEYAVYAFAWAMEEASMEHMASIGTKYKKTIASPDCCLVCQGNKNQGSIPVAEPFQSGHMHAPFCTKCRCATTAARE
jgi:hypothetical protein